MKEIKYDIYKRLKLMEIKAYGDTLIVHKGAVRTEFGIIGRWCGPIRLTARIEVCAKLITPNDRLEVSIAVINTHDFDQRVIQWTDMSDTIIPTRENVLNDLKNKLHLI